MLGILRNGEHEEVDFNPDFRHPIAIDFGRTSETSRCFLVHGRECPQLNADYILIQPDVIAKDPRRGWVPIGGQHVLRPEEQAREAVYVGREETPQLRLGPDVSRSHCEIESCRKPGGESLTLTTHSRDEGSYARIIAHPDDIEELPSNPSRVR